MKYSIKNTIESIIITFIVGISCASIGAYLALKPNNPILRGAKNEVTQMRNHEDKASESSYQTQILAQNIASINDEYDNHWGIQKISFNRKINNLIITIKSPKHEKESNYLNSNVPITKRTERALEVGNMIGRQYHVSNLQTRVHETYNK